MSTKIVQYIRRKKTLCSTCAQIKEQKQFPNKTRKVRTCVANAFGPHIFGTSSPTYPRSF